jgi:DNA mismatch repair protein MutS
MAKSSSDTPLMQQHRAIKQKYPDAILLFRVGDFYETFGEDAVRAADVLGITLTKRNNGAAASSELAGFPHHALDTYLHKLVKAGYRVAICDQLEDPKMAKGIVKRGVTEMVTPGIATSDKLLEHHSNNFLAGIHFQEDQFGISFLDISTGEFFLAEGDEEYMDKLLQALKPAEVIFQRNYQKTFKERFGEKFYTYALESWVFDETYAREILLKQFQTHSLKGFGVDTLRAGIVAAGAIIHYLKETEHPNLQHITNLQRIDREDYLWMDRFTIRNLELIQSGADQGNTLLKVLDHTVSPMGARLMKRWLLLPLNDSGKIRERLDLVEFFVKDQDFSNQLIQKIRQIGDMERLSAKIPLKKINPREVLQIGKSLSLIEQIRQACETVSIPYLKRLADALHPCALIRDRIFTQITDNPPAQLNKGEVIRSGVNEELDELRRIAFGGKEHLVQIQQKEAERTGISSLKIGYNNIFGYYLEVTNSHKNKVPAEWIRKQTLTSAERYVTAELKDYEEKITGAETKIATIEQQMFEELLAALEDYLAPMQVNGNMVAIMDVLTCFASNALRFQYRKPEINEENRLSFKECRHPVIERNLPAGEMYIANDILLDPGSLQIIILTGPNMSGKSALLRQTALITLMAHIGSFVPAEQASVPITDKIFTRVGASDNLSGGESTFMVEMNETASILNNLTARSLIILDEIGRGTSTYDGISIAWSIAEFLHESPQAPKTLFATHYHELNELENRFPRIRNFHITNKEVGNKIIFLRKMAPGGSKHSFGIHVARMAGMPAALIQRATQLLSQLEQLHGKDSLGEHLVSPPPAGNLQLSIFDAHSATFDEIRKKLEGLDINRLTPVEALLILNEIKNILK